MAEHIVVGGLDAWLHYGANAKTHAKVFVVLVHGRTRSHKDTDFMAQQVCKALPEVVCATYDMPNHGARIVDESLNGDWETGNAEHFTTMMATIDQGSADAESLLRYVPLIRPELAECRRVLSGVSLGGHVVWKLVSEMANRDELLDGAMPIISTPDLASLFETRYAKQRPAIAEATALPPALMTELRSRVVLRYNVHKTNFPLLAVCGANDQIVPPGPTVEWGRSGPETQQVIVLDGVGHELPPRMMELLIDFVRGFYY